MIKEITTAIHMTDEEAIRFVAFQKHYAFIQALEDLKVFDVKSGSVEIHFDVMGRIGSIDIHRHYRP